MPLPVIGLILNILLSFPSFAHQTVSTIKDDVTVVDYEGLVKYMDQFMELPYFEEVTGSYPEEEVVVVLVSLDFSKQIDTKLKPFLKKNQLQSKVILLDDPDQNAWIDKVDPRWSGAIPVTLIRKGDRQEFYEKTFHSYDELNTLIQSFLNS
jgi:hypothetical protein